MLYLYYSAFISESGVFSIIWVTSGKTRKSSSSFYLEKEKKIMKKFFAFTVAAAMLVGATACSVSDVVDSAVDEANNAIESAANDAGDAIESVESEVSEGAESLASDASEAVESVVEDIKGEGVMTYAEYIAAENDTEVTIEAYVQDTQSWWNDQITVYLQDHDGAYFAYNMACSEEDAASLVAGQKIKVTGFKSEWAGEVEIIDATFELEDGNWIAEAADVTDLLGTDALADHMNEFVAFSDLTIEASLDADGNEVAFLYNWDGSGAEGTDSDLYFNASVNGETYTFVIEYYLRDENTDAYQAVQGLEIGDTVDLEGFLYWYEGAQPHVTSVTVK